ncbi:hypothetical protein ABZ756_13860 [Mammaliicoccus sciuri]|uniref:hypothetical protein n=1 Tax=Sporosarcina sp. FSL W7-1283 TaxID=2921560 RepID=UPI0030FB9D59
MITVDNFNVIDEEYNRIMERNAELLDKQEEMLLDQPEKYKSLIELYKNKGYKFKHPEIKHGSLGGPVIGYYPSEHSLVVYVLDKGFVKVDLNTNEIKNTFARTLIRDGLFEQAMQGFKFLEVMLDDYKKDLEMQASELEKEINKYSN